MKNFKSLWILSILLPMRMMCVPLPVPAQNGELPEAILVITGASSEEELDEQEVERFQHYLSHPLEINVSSRSRLLSSGLLSQYQVASLADYRSRSGDVLSFAELSAVEGFGEEYVAALRPFISLRSRNLPGQPVDDTVRIRNDALARAAYKGSSFNYGTKYRFAAGDVAEASFAARTTYQDDKLFPPSSWSFNAAYYGRKRLGKAVLGDYNLRFGQGLSLWSGMSLSGFSSSSSFSRRPTGLSPSWSWSGTGSHRGVAADYQFGRFSMVSFLSLPGLRECMEGSAKAHVCLMPGTAIGWFGRNGQASLAAWCSGEGDRFRGKVSGDVRWNLFGADLFGEAAFDLFSGTVAAVAGATVPVLEGWKASVVARLYPSAYDGSFSAGVRSWTKTSDERGVAFGLEKHGIQLTADLAAKVSDRSRRQCKFFVKAPVQLSRNAVLSLRLTERIRPYEEYLKYRSGVRADVDWSSGGLSARYGEAVGDAWKARLRVEGLLCRSLAGLTYLEGGRKTDRWYAYFRGTLFLVDYWDDRIYSYERDAPGCFTVPAYYGRGYSISAVGGVKLRSAKRKTLKMYFRVSTSGYPFMKDPKPQATEAKAQMVASF